MVLVVLVVVAYEGIPRSDSCSSVLVVLVVLVVVLGVFRHTDFHNTTTKKRNQPTFLVGTRIGRDQGRAKRAGPVVVASVAIQRVHIATSIEEEKSVVGVEVGVRELFYLVARSIICNNSEDC